MNKSMRLFWAVVSAVLLLLLIFLVIYSNNLLTGNTVKEYSGMDSFISCLNDKNVRVFGTYDDNTKMQASLFQDKFYDLNFVDCSQSPAICYGVIIYPTWQINNIIIYGGLSLEALSKFSGCEL